LNILHNYKRKPDGAGEHAAVYIPSCVNAVIDGYYVGNC